MRSEYRPSATRAQKGGRDLLGRVLNRSVTKLQVTVWDENQAHEEVLSKIMDGGAELTVKALAKVVPDIRDKGPGTHVSWKVLALDDKGSPLKPGAKPPTRCGKFLI